VEVESGGSGGMSSESKLELCKLFALDTSDAENACVGDLGFDELTLRQLWPVYKVLECVKETNRDARMV
jgi:hypothetical protein